MTDPIKQQEKEPTETIETIDSPTLAAATTPLKDPTDRWVLNVRNRPKYRIKRAARHALDEGQEYEDRVCPVKAEINAWAESAQECIVKRPLTSMVVAATAGAAITAILATLVGSKRNR